MILKKMAEDPYQSLFTTNTEEVCPNYDSVLLKTLKNEWKHWHWHWLQQYDKENRRQSLPSYSYPIDHFRMQPIFMPIIFLTINNPSPILKEIGNS
jgi:hypothetical protein